MLSNHPAKSGGHRHCGSRYMMFLMVEEEDSLCTRLNLLLVFISKVHGMPCTHT